MIKYKCDLLLKNMAFLLIAVACSSVPRTEKTSSVDETNITTINEFSPGELILGAQLLNKIFDGEMAPLECVPDQSEAGLLLRTIRPRMEVVQDDMEAMLDDSKSVDDLIKNCSQNCTCQSVDELLREHQVTLTKSQQKIMNSKRGVKETNRCLLFAQRTFCEGELFKTLQKEKVDFSFED
jgi:hypothetical protein